MTREYLQELLLQGPLFLDGATGTNLQKAGLPSGVCPELWIYEHPDAIIDLQRRYVEAGTNIVLAPTFTANRIKLAEYGLEDRLEDINRMMVRLSRQAVGDKAFVAADLTMTGQQLYPVGDMIFEDLIDVYKEQIRAIIKEENGIDLFIIETMMSLQECRAAVLAIKETCPEYPIIVSLTYNEDGRTLYGTSPDTAVITLQAMGVDIVGMNCSTGPEAMIPLVEQMMEYANVPVMVKPNAGLPVLEDGKTLYKMTPEEFAADCEKLFNAGASLIGGCCGTTPEHIAAMTALLSSKETSYSIQIKQKLVKSTRVVTSERMNTRIDLNGNFMVVGERINPTGKKKLQEDLKKGSLSMVRDFALAQERDGAKILDINMGMNGIDEKQMMLDAIYEVTSTVDLPLCIDTSHIDIMEAALRIYPGRALINSIPCEEEKMEKLLPIAKKYGAMFILLPLSGAGLPKDLNEKKTHISKVLEAAKQCGLTMDDVVVDVLVTTVGANPNAGNECFETIAYCKDELGLPTVCGLSNISFGMPGRMFVNSAYLTVAVSKGLTMAIANPSQEMLMILAYATDLLLNKPGASEIYIASDPQSSNLINQNAGNSASNSANASNSVTNQATTANAGAASVKADAIMECVVKGNKDRIVDEIKAEMAKGTEPQAIIEGHLIPGINKVGELYDKKKYFLPQLIAGANAMKAGMEFIEPLLADSGDKEAKATIVFATVQGDIHDIGKNLVVLMLKNYGYNVVDLGKDVPSELIVEQAIKLNADIIGLSALMTTTMMKMKEVVELAKDKGCTSKIIIGGACITESFKDEIKADGYSEDAADCVKLVQRLLG